MELMEGARETERDRTGYRERNVQGGERVSVNLYLVVWKRNSKRRDDSLSAFVCFLRGLVIAAFLVLVLSGERERR